MGVFPQRELIPARRSPGTRTEHVKLEPKRGKTRAYLSSIIHRKAGTTSCLNATIWFLWHTVTQMLSLAVDLNRDSNFFFISDMRQPINKVYIVRESNSKPWIFLSITLIWQAKNSFSFSISQQKSIHLFLSVGFLFYASLDGRKNVLSVL